MNIFDNEIAHVPQRHHDDTGVCCVAMVAGVSYDVAAEAIFRDNDAPHSTIVTRLSWHCDPSDIRKGLSALHIRLNHRELFAVPEVFDVRSVQPALLTGMFTRGWKPSWVLLHDGKIYDPSDEGPIDLDEWATDIEGFISLQHAHYGATQHGLG